MGGESIGQKRLCGQSGAWARKAIPSGKAVRVEDLAKDQQIPQNYLVQILIELKSKQIVKSVRGKEGGYLLDKAPEDISLAEVLRCIHGNVFEPAALHNQACPQALKDAWSRFSKSLMQLPKTSAFTRSSMRTIAQGNVLHLGTCRVEGRPSRELTNTQLAKEDGRSFAFQA